MSGTNPNPVPTRALWTWTTVSGQAPVVTGYPTTGGPTKTGLMPADLFAYLQVPIQQYGNPPTPIPDTTIIQWLRWAEDQVEQESNIRLCQTWIAAPPAKTNIQTQSVGLAVSGNYQQLGVDYDFDEPAYDFLYQKFRDEGWGYQKLRWKPVKGVEIVDPTALVDALNVTGVKNISYIYPLLNEFFRVPLTWIVEDQMRGYIRLVPSVNVQMLPLFAVLLAFEGFAESVPGGMWYQYTAGLTANDYASQWSFIRQLVLARAGIIALGRMQLSVNFGALETQMTVDGLQYRTKYDKDGPFSGQIRLLEAEAKMLMKQAKSKVGGPTIGII